MILISEQMVNVIKQEAVSTRIRLMIHRVMTMINVHRATSVGMDYAPAEFQKIVAI